MKRTIICALCALLPWVTDAEASSSRSETVRLIRKVNTCWQANNPAEVRSFWDNAAYHTGNIEVYKLLKDESMLQYSVRWAEHNRWQGATETDRSKWKYKDYGEGQDYVLFGDWQICFQTYIDLYGISPDERKVARAKEVMGYEADSKAADYWWWADALYMVMPVMTKMYKLTGDVKYLDKLYRNLLYSDSIMLDKETGLYFRDGKYVYPKHKTATGKKDFWARGDGWVLAGLAKVLQDMPAGYRHHDFFVEKFRRLAYAVAALQQDGGYWTRSMMDPEQAPGPETSGTAFFTYGMLWGMNNGYLPQKDFKKVIDKSWKYLTKTALQPDGRIGYVQPIGERAIPGQTIDARSEANFGTGAFLLAACEYVRYLDGGSVIKDAIRPGAIWPDDKGTHINAHGGGILEHKGTYYWFGEHKSDTTSSAMVGVTCYSSKDLVHWKNGGVALSVTDEPGSDIERGCILERPKVVYNAKTGKFVMWFHLELKGLGYRAARAAVAVADKPEGPYTYLRSGRVNAYKYAIGTTEADKRLLDTLDMEAYQRGTPEWRRLVEKGMFMQRDLHGGQMSRDMTVFVDDDGKAYHIFSSEENLTIQIAELSDDYTFHTGRYARVAPGGQNEAPAVFKKDGKYWMITSGCTGWAPNKARMFSADNIFGPWTQHPNPCVGPNADLTFGGQSTYVMEKDGRFIFMADIWRPDYPSDARYIWLPIDFEQGRPVVRWQDCWVP